MSDLQSEAQTESRPRYIAIIVMGVSGTGKTTLAAALAREWNVEYIEGDELHSRENIEKMSSGCALNDRDREPWLERIRKIMEQRAECVLGQSEAKREGDVLVITCSALKKSYRDILRGRPRDGSGNPLFKSATSLATYFVYIKGSKEMVLQRMKERKGHFMKSGMLDSQFDDLENPEGEGDVVVVNAEDSTESQIDKAKEKIAVLTGGHLTA